MAEPLTVVEAPAYQPLPHAAGDICLDCWMRHQIVCPIGATIRINGEEHHCTHHPTEES